MNQLEMMDDSKYIPINCSFYDVLESFATLKEPVKIVVQLDDGKITTIFDQIHDLQTMNGEEFMLMKSGQQFRLDSIVSVNGITYNQFPFSKSC